jgi:hypothetical protein
MAGSGLSLLSNSIVERASRIAPRAALRSPSSVEEGARVAETSDSAAGQVVARPALGPAP